MAEPKTEIDRRLDRIELAINTLAQYLVNEQIDTGFMPEDAASIERILKGEKAEAQ